MNRNRTALYPFTNMLTVDIPTLSRAQRVPGTCQADDVLNFSFTSVRDRKLFLGLSTVSMFVNVGKGYRAVLFVFLLMLIYQLSYNNTKHVTSKQFVRFG